VNIRRTLGDPMKPPRGFPAWAWWTLFLSTFLFAVPLTSPWWSTVLRSEIQGADDEGEDAPGNAAATPEAVVPGSVLKVVLHTRLVGQAGLGTIEREVPYVRGIIPQIKTAVSELTIGTPEAAPLLPPGTRVLDAAYTQGGTVFIDFSTELESSRGVGVEEERVVVQGIVTTIIENFPAVRGVLILVDGKTPKTGHFDLSRPLRPDDPIFEVEEPEPSPDPAAPATAPTPTPLSTPGTSKEGRTPPR